MSDLNTLASAAFTTLSLVLLQSCSLGPPIAQVEKLADPQRHPSPDLSATRYPMADHAVTPASQEMLWESELIQAGAGGTLAGQTRLLP